MLVKLMFFSMLAKECNLFHRKSNLFESKFHKTGQVIVLQHRFRFCYNYLVLFCSRTANLLIFFNTLYFTHKQFSKVLRASRTKVNRLLAKDIQDMNPCLNTWPPHLKNLICLVESSPIASLPHSTKKKTNATVEAAWTDIASQLYSSTRKCKLQWKKIKLRYAKIMNLIKTGKITLEDAKFHPETSRYLDGHLSFLDPYISDITDEDIPLDVHRSINMYFMKTKNSIKGTPRKNIIQFVTHLQVKALLSERKLRGENVKNMDSGHLLTVLDMAVERKLGELLLMPNASSNPSNNIANNNGDENTVNLPVMPSKNVKITSKNNLNNNEENRTRPINLELQSELILDDDIKVEEEDDINTEEEVDISTDDEDFVNSQEANIVEAQYEHSINNQNEDYVGIKKENHTTLEKNINNTTEINDDLEICLPRSKILTIGQHSKDKAVKGLPEDAILIENNTNNVIDTPIVTDEYIRSFFSELGVVMSMELSLEKQKVLKSRINELLRNVLFTKSDGPNMTDVDSEEE